MTLLVLVPVGWAAGRVFCDQAACAGNTCTASIPAVVPAAHALRRVPLPGNEINMSSGVVEPLSGWLIGGIQLKSAVACEQSGSN